VAQRSTRPARISGIGIVSAYGWGRDVFFDGLTSGVSAVRPVAIPGSDPGETFLVGQIPDGGDPADAPSRFGRALFGAAREAVFDATRAGWIPGRRVGLILSTTLGENELRRHFLMEAGGTLRARTYLSLMPSTAPSLVLGALGFAGGPAMNIQAACAGGNMALQTGKLWLDAGIADDVLVCAVDLPNIAEDVRHFAKMRALVTVGDPMDVCRPFQVGTRGFVTGDGAVVYVLTHQDVAGYADVLGAASTHDPFHPISINPDYTVLADAYELALANAGVDGGDVAYLNAHGAGTAQCDAAETQMLHRFLPNARVYSIKPLCGHAHGAASLLEGSVAVLAYQNKFLPAPSRVADVNPPLRPDELINGITEISGGITVKASMGMGGYNAVSVFAPIS
jgi:3-oxoacyl-[acyl-carrier-protein] synthase II